MSNFRTSANIVKAIDEITSSNMTSQEKEIAARKIINNLSAEECRGYMEFCKTAKMSLREGDRGFKKSDSGKYILMEIDTLTLEFMEQMAFLGNMKYILERLSAYRCKAMDRKVITKFIREVYGTKETDLGTIKEVLSEKSTVVIPEMPEPYNTKMEPCYERFMDAYNYCMENYEELRVATRACFGTTPSMESSVFVHGVFNSEEAADKYRIEHHKDIDCVAHCIPIGKKVLTDPFRDMISGITVYDPTDPDAEGLFRAKNAQSRVRANKILSRINKDKDSEIDPETIAHINKYTNSVKDIDDVLDNRKIAREKQEILREARTKLQMKVESEIDKACEDGKVLITITDKKLGQRPVKVTEEERRIIQSEMEGSN